MFYIFLNERFEMYLIGSDLIILIYILQTGEEILLNFICFSLSLSLAYEGTYNLSLSLIHYFFGYCASIRERN